MKSFKSVFICVFMVLCSCNLSQESTIQVNFANDCSPQQQAEAHQVIIDRIETVYKVKKFTQPKDGSFSVTYFPKEDLEIVNDLLEKKGEIIIYESYFASEIKDLLSDVIEEESMLYHFFGSVPYNPNYQNPVIGTVQEKDMAFIDSLLCREEIKMRLPKDASLLWTKKDVSFGNAAHSLIAVKMNNSMPLNQKTVKKASLEKSYDNGIMIELHPDFHQKWAAMTKNNINRNLPFVCDGTILSYPKVMTEITGGRLSIISNFTTEETYVILGFTKGGVLNCPAYIGDPK